MVATIRREFIPETNSYAYLVVRITGRGTGNYTSDTARVIGKYLPNSLYTYNDLQYNSLIKSVTNGDIYVIE